MGTRDSPFTTKLPLELRRKIYEDVLRYDDIGKKRASFSEACARFNVSLFLVNRDISQESREVFFETNTIHVRPDQVAIFIGQHGHEVIRLQIEEEAEDSALLVRKFSEAAVTVANCTSLLPKLRIVTFKCPQSLRLTVRQLVHQLVDQSQGALNLNFNQLRCINVGTFVLPMTQSNQEWRFSYTLLADLWDLWSQRPSDFRLGAQDIEDYFSNRGAIRIPEWVFENGPKRSASMRLHNTYGLAAQIRCYSSVESMLPSLKPQSARLDVLRRFELIGNWKIKWPVLQWILEFAGQINLRDVQHEHGSEVLEWATELLAPNTKDFAAGFGRSSEEAEKYVRKCKSR